MQLHCLLRALHQDKKFRWNFCLAAADIYYSEYLRKRISLSCNIHPSSRFSVMHLSTSASFSEKNTRHKESPTNLHQFSSHWLYMIVQEVWLKIVNTQLQRAETLQSTVYQSTA
jgi:hypothetical protein